VCDLRAKKSHSIYASFCYARSMGPESPNSPTPVSPAPQARGTELLRREVLYPQRQSTGVGVMLVASAAMFFAVASSTFILRAQMPRDTCFHMSEMPSSIRAVPVELVSEEEMDQLSMQTCGDPLYEENGDGSVSIVFDLCVPPGTNP